MPNRPELAEVLDLLLDAICAIDREGRFVYVNAAAERLFGYRPEELVGRTMIELVAPEDRARTLATANRVMSGEPLAHFENSYLHKNGHLVPVMWTARWSERHGLRLAVARDMSESRRAERLQQTLYAISEATHEAHDLPALLARVHAIIDRQLPASRFAVALAEGSGQPLRYLYLADSEASASSSSELEPMCRQICERGEAVCCELAEAGENGTTVSWLGVPLRGPTGAIGCLSLSRRAPEPGYEPSDLELLRYVSTQIAAAIERKRLQERLTRMAHYDVLTGLPNRSLLQDRLQVAIARAKRRNSQVALLFIDLDGFKQINDRLGHAAGDEVLRQTAQRLLGAVRASDTVARIGGDEFIMLMECLADEQPIERVREVVQGYLSRELPGREALPCTASIGVALFPDDGESAEALLMHADQTMYANKRTKRRSPAEA